MGVATVIWTSETEGECAAEVGFNTFLERGLRRDSGLLRVRDGCHEDCEQQKCD